ncbi:CPBP family intramembrane metalloprotease [Pigmentiphaga soli]|uniref:CPBP family intramembrane metalloprotease n=1 Tax=Pigmentiphaga soli TaxID=1007095 RepID=A0ABP8GWC7_9BURK
MTQTPSRRRAEGAREFPPAARALQGPPHGRLPPAWWTALALFAAGYALALLHGRLLAPSLAAFGLLALAGACVRQRPAAVRIAGHAIFLCAALALALHLLPGFGNALVIDHAILAPGSAPYSMYLNLDKPLIALWLLWACPWIAPPCSAAAAGRAILRAAPATVAVCLGCAVAAGLVDWSPKWPPQAWIWMGANLLQVCVAEEALFRGYVQGGLDRHGSTLSRAALPLSALLFGLAHAGAGWPWMALAALAGLGYGLAYRQGGLLAAIAAHFLLNLAHFGLFSYPMLPP